jgi:hypothetical protein
VKGPVGEVNQLRRRSSIPPASTDQTASDLETPASGTGYFYLVTAENAGGAEGGLGRGHVRRDQQLRAVPVRNDTT